jgi:hypothetical protein
VRSAADLGDARAGRERDLIEQPARFMRELLCLLLQPLLLRLSVTKNVLVGLGHDGSSTSEAVLRRLTRRLFGDDDA